MGSFLRVVILVPPYYHNESALPFYEIRILTSLKAYMAEQYFTIRSFSIGSDNQQQPIASWMYSLS
ncbi:hypothetical protein Cenrod_1676 [Candidatus Symbiobacter mobilis CR]|uniref:Uncharacterized protein n=1 Tax=Candidatus Symbiobacter mobilis CR TaxID=946483 RepID=U5N871_9BURK|nr:hypothetical protein Cenrod_1676 [Candidatus Symbiobacter mobilis CR]